MNKFGSLGLMFGLMSKGMMDDNRRTIGLSYDDFKVLDQHQPLCN